MKYETDPVKIREQSSKLIKEEVSLNHLEPLEQQIAISMIQACGDPSILENLRFSDSLVEKGLDAISEDFELLCDTNTVARGINKKYLRNETICLLDKASVISQAKSNKRTRSMTAVDLWQPYLSDSIILIGSEPTALFRLLELLNNIKEDHKKPALIIATPAGLVGAKDAKLLLWEKQSEINIPCITMLGTGGGCHLTTAAITTLLKTHYENMQSSS